MATNMLTWFARKFGRTVTGFPVDRLLGCALRVGLTAPFLLLAVLFLSQSVQAKGNGTWFLNAFGVSLKYQIFMFDEDGVLASLDPVASPDGVRQKHVAWPSAIKIGTDIFLYASVYDGKQWSQVHLWRSKDGKLFKHIGSVLDANMSVDEKFGIGPTQVTYDPDSTEPFIMYYLVRGQKGPGSTITLALSKDGINWRKTGAVLIKAELPDEKYGLSMSYVCKMRNGSWALFYQGYEHAYSAVPIMATSISKMGPFRNKTILLRGDGYKNIVIQGSKGNSFVKLQRSSTVPIGRPLLIYDGNGKSREIVVAIKQRRDIIMLNRPLQYSYKNVNIFSMSFGKIDPSYAQELPDGSWKGIFTAYGPTPGVVAEYTIEVGGGH